VISFSPEADAVSRSAGEHMLATVRQVLGVPELSETDDFFDAGMTSLAALELADGFSSVLGRDVTVADIYCAATVERVLRLAAEAAEAPRSDAGPAPTLSHAQRRFWLAEQMAPAAADNLLVLAYLLTGPLRPDALDQALADVVERHPILRTRYDDQRRDVRPEVMPAEAAGITIERVEPPPGPAGPEAVAARITSDWWDLAFELDRQPPLRARLCRLDAETHLLCLQIHHIAFDGRSEQVFINDLSAFYRTRVTPDRDEAPPPLAATYADYAERERITGVDQADLAFWRRVLADPPRPVLPAPAEPDAEAERLEVVRRIPAATVSAVHSASRQRRAPALAALMAAAARALASVFRASDVCLGAVAEGRPRSGDNATIGYFVNPLAVPLHLADDQDTAGLLDHVASRLLDALQHSRVPFDEVVRVLRPRRERHPFFQTLVILQYEQPSGEFAPGTTIAPVQVPQPRTAIEFMVEAFPQPDGSWDLRLAWRADGCDAFAAGELADAVAATLDRIAALGG
jgi:mycobactin peptide synthetase MbtE